MQNITRNSLLLRITSIKTMDEHICINEEGHDRKDPPLSNRGLRVGLRTRASRGMQRSVFPGGPTPVQRVGGVDGEWQRSLCGMRRSIAFQRVSPRRPVASPDRLPDEFFTARRVSLAA